MSSPTSNSPKLQALEAAWNFQLPGHSTTPATPAPLERLDSFVSAQSLAGQAALQGVSPFDGVFNIDGLLFIQLDGRVFEVEFDVDNFRYNIVAPHAPARNEESSQIDALNHEQILQNWHPLYLAGSQAWVLLPASTNSVQEQARRVITLPCRVDGLLTTGDLNTIASTVEGFLQEQAPRPQNSTPATTLLSLLAPARLSILETPHSSAPPGQTQLRGVLDAMLRSADADALADQLLAALGWYGADNGETTDPIIRHQLVWAALMLELDPPALQRAGHLAGCDLEGPDNWGLTYPQRRARLLAALSLKTTTPELALCILAPAAPDFMVETSDNDLHFGTASWVNFVHGVALSEALQPGASQTLTPDALIELPLNLSEGATDEQKQLIAATRARPSIIWAVSHGALPISALHSHSLADLDVASRALDEHLEQAAQAFEGLTRETPDRIEIATDTLTERLGSSADRVKARIMYPTGIGKRLEFSLRNPHPGLPAGKFYLLDIFAAGHLRNGLDQFQPLTHLDQAGINAAFAPTAHALKGIDIPAMYDAAFRFYEARAKAGYAFIIENLLAQLPADDRRALQNGTVTLHTLRQGTGKPVGWETHQDRVRARGRYGFILECRYRDSTFFYEVFPFKALLVRHAQLPIPTRRKAPYPSILPSVLEIKPPSAVNLDWNAYQTLAAPEAGKVSYVISEQIVQLEQPDAQAEETPVPLSSTRFNEIAFAAASEHLFFDPHDTYLYHRHQTGSESVANNHPPILRSLALVVPGLSCANAVATGETAEVACALDGLIFIAPAFRFLRASVRMLIRAGQSGIAQTMPTFARLTSALLIHAGIRFPRTMRAAGGLTGDLVGRLVKEGAVGVEAFHTLAARMNVYVGAAAGNTAGYKLVAGIPSVTTPGAWRASSGFDLLGQVDGIRHVPVRRVSNSASASSGSHYLMTPDVGKPYGPRLIRQKPSLTALQRINAQAGYPLSGRGALRSPIASPNSGVLGGAVDGSADLTGVLQMHHITATREQVAVIRASMDDGIPVFVYERSNGSKSLALHDVHDGLYLDVFTNAQVHVFRFYNHKTTGTWQVPSSFGADVIQVKPGSLVAHRPDLSQTRLDSVRSAIEAGQPLPPIKVSVLPEGRYSVIDGNHRLAVAHEMGLQTVPIMVI